MNNRFLIILALIVLGFGGFFWFSKNKAKAPSGDTNQNATSQHIVGEGTKNVTLLEYADFQCPACATMEPILEQIRTKYAKEIKFQFRHFPLTQIHQNAMASHRAAEAAGKQGKFWEMHDMIYARQESWSNSSKASAIFEDYASEIGLNIDTYKVDVVSSAVNDTINADKSAGDQVGVSGTPTFLINGQKIENPKNAEEFYKIIDDAISKNSQ